MNHERNNQAISHRALRLSYRALIGAVDSVAADVLPAPGPFLAHVYKGQLYGIKRFHSGYAGTECRLTREQLDKPVPKGIPAKQNIRFYTGNSGDEGEYILDLPIRWRIANDVLWAMTDGVMDTTVLNRIAMSELDLFDQNDPKREDKLMRRYPHLKRHDGMIIGDEYCFQWGLEKVRDYRRWLPRWSPRFANMVPPPFDETSKIISRELAFADFLPIGPSSGRLFVLEEGECRVWSVLGTFAMDPAVKRWSETYSEKPVAKINLDFTEPFIVFAKGDSYLFATRSGKLYGATKSTDDKWKVEKLWSQANRPIHAVITDAATNRSYAFTQAKADKDGKTGKDVYFEFDTKLDPVEFDRTKLKPFQLDPPMDILRSYTQVLIDAKKIAPTPPKKKE